MSAPRDLVFEVWIRPELAKRAQGILSEVCKDMGIAELRLEDVVRHHVETESELLEWIDEATGGDSYVREVRAYYERRGAEQ